jgi:hypothetical protein
VAVGAVATPLSPGVRLRAGVETRSMPPSRPGDAPQTAVTVGVPSLGTVAPSVATGAASASGEA